MSFHLYGDRNRLRNPREEYQQKLRRDKIKMTVFMILGVIAVVAFIVFAAYASVQAQKSCEAQGGVYESDGECEVNGEDLYELD